MTKVGFKVLMYSDEKFPTRRKCNFCLMMIFQYLDGMNEFDGYEFVPLKPSKGQRTHKNGWN